MAGFWRTPTWMVFLDQDNAELARVDDANLVPRVGENVQIKGVPYVVDRVGYDIRAREIQRVLVVCRLT